MPDQVCSWAECLDSRYSFALLYGLLPRTWADAKQGLGFVLSTLLVLKMR